MDQQTAISVAVVGAGGAIMGAFVGALGAWIVERSRRGQADRHRFASERQALYARFLRAANAIEWAVSQYVDQVRLGDDASRREAVAAIPDPETMMLAYEEIRLLASDRVVTAAGDLLWATLEEHRQTWRDRGLLEHAPALGDFPGAQERQRLALIRFEAFAREELAVDPGGPVGRLRRRLVARWDLGRRNRAGL